MKTRWKVKVWERREFTVEVEASDWSEARDLASAIPSPIVERVDYGADPISNDAPIHCDAGYMGSEDLFVFKSPYGVTFTKEDVAAILHFIAAELGFEVHSFWNGAGCRTFSVRVVGAAMPHQGRFDAWFEARWHGDQEAKKAETHA